MPSPSRSDRSRPRQTNQPKGRATSCAKLLLEPLTGGRTPGSRDRERSLLFCEGFFGERHIGDVPGSFRIVEGEGFHGQGGWTVRIGCIVHWIEEDKVYLTREAAEARLRALSA